MATETGAITQFPAIHDESGWLCGKGLAGKVTITVIEMGVRAHDDLGGEGAHILAKTFCPKDNALPTMQTGFLKEGKVNIVQTRPSPLDGVVEPSSKTIQAGGTLQRTQDSNLVPLGFGPCPEGLRPHVVTTAGGGGKNEDFQGSVFGMAHSLIHDLR